LFIDKKSCWREHSYGIFDQLIWKNIIAVGFGVTFDRIGDVDPIEFIIYDTDYRVVRTTLMYLIDFISFRLEMPTGIYI
jgi:hypothetical protein